MTLQKKNILALTDGRAGHRSKTQGVLNALAQLAPIEVIWLEVRAPHAILRSLSRWLTRWTKFDSLAWYLPQAVHDELPQKIDLVVSSGADTLVPNVLLSRHYACPNIINSSLKGLPADQFSTVFQLGQTSNNAQHSAYLALTVPPNQMSFDHDGQRMLAARQRLAVSSDRLVVQQLAVGHGAGGDHAHHLALHRAFARDFAHLLADGHRFAQLEQAAQVGFDRMEGHTRHHHRLSGRLAPRGERDVQQPGGLFGIGPEHLVKVTHAVEHQRGRKLRLDGQVLGHHGGVALGLEFGGGGGEVGF